MSERGTVTVLAAAVVAVTASVMVLAVDIHRLVVARSIAQTAADSAALAAAPLTFARLGSELTPEAEAMLFASANGASLISCVCPHDPVWRPRTVVVHVAVSVDSLLPVRQVTAVAAAEFDPTVWLDP